MASRKHQRIFIRRVDDGGPRGDERWAIFVGDNAPTPQRRYESVSAAIIGAVDAVALFRERSASGFTYELVLGQIVADHLAANELS